MTCFRLYVSRSRLVCSDVVPSGRLNHDGSIDTPWSTAHPSLAHLAIITTTITPLLQATEITEAEARSSGLVTEGLGQASPLVKKQPDKIQFAAKATEKIADYLRLQASITRYAAKAMAAQFGNQPPVPLKLGFE